MPCSSPSGISSVRPRAEADDLGGHRRRGRGRWRSAHLADLGLEAGGLDDQADQVADAAVAAVQVGARDGVAEALQRRDSAIGELVLEHLAGARELGLERRVDLALGRAHDGAAAGDAALGLHLAVLDAAELAHEPPDGVAHELEVVGVDEDQ